MRCLSGQQPWWFAITHLGKRIENRSDESSAHKALLTYREPFLLHASAGVGSIEDFDSACAGIFDVFPGDASAALREHLARHVRRHRQVFIPRESLQRGGIVGVARCVGLLTPSGAPYREEGIKACQRYNPDARWKMPGQWGHILADVRPLPFVPCKGALGLWRVPDDVMAQVRL